MSELKPCPFCGEPADGRYQRLAKCCNDKCLMNEVEDDTLFYLDEAWNNRPIEDALQARIAELEAKKDILENQLREATNFLIDKKLHVDSLYEDGFKLQKRIAELEAAQARWIPVSERLPEESGWYRVGAIDVFDEGYTDEAYFGTMLGWRSPVRDEIYCWLDGVPELPQPPEVQE